MIGENFNFQVKDSEKELIFESAKKLLADLDLDIEKSTFIDVKNRSANLFLFNEVKKFSKNTSTTLINAYKLTKNEYVLKFSVNFNKHLRAIWTTIATNNDGEIKFSSPINHRTKSWKNEQIGKVNYFYKNSLNRKTAKQFDKKNSEIAKKFGVDIKNLNFYKCSNYAEVQRLFGIDFDSKSAGIVQASEDFEDTIITGVNSENYSHDVFHMYIQDIFPDDKDRNFIAEEGYANSIADAYYAKNNGEIISRRELVFQLKDFVKKNPKTDLLELFQKDSRVYFQDSDQVSEEVFNQLSVKSTITSLICDEVEKVKGFDGLIELLRGGKGEDAFFDSTKNLIGLSKSNFNEKVRKLINKF